GSWSSSNFPTRWSMPPNSTPAISTPSTTCCSSSTARYLAARVATAAAGGGGGGRGLPKPEDVPEKYRKMLGRITQATTLPQVKAFVQNGGTAVAVGGSTRLG